MHASGFDRTRPLLLLVMAAAALGGFALGHPGIVSTQNLDSMAVFGIEIGMIALGQTLVICGGDTGIDLSVGAIAGLAQVILGRLLHLDLAWPVAIGMTLLAGLVLGGINAVAISWFRIPPIIATLATLFGYQGLALVLTGGINIDLTHESPLFLAIGQGHVLGLPLQLVALYLPLLAAFAFLQHGTRFGRALYLAGTNDRAADLAGLRASRIRAATYVLCGLVSTIAGIVGAARLGTARPDAAGEANLISIAIVVLGGTGIFGGTGSVIGTALATVVIGIVDYGLSYNDFNPIYQAGVIGVILIGVILVENPFVAWRDSRRTNGA
ncbi:ABC transporter permease [Acidiphilium sp. AL]|uniref:Autoinducer 2 import system permease protein LsrD n=1 Tax=Acidiphilium iwatense TaxID=768198 RepID=A0ABS9DU70_9PROT|nr:MULTISPECIES: ABC transporter permease [Acidiphilium]MCF3946276.1 ABC transporter permease [Acidiphilium iwatense]MCU4158848.1 ABC transporter permease [Acidiphilium sp. AL]